MALAMPAPAVEDRPDGPKMSCGMNGLLPAPMQPFILCYPFTCVTLKWEARGKVQSAYGAQLLGGMAEKIANFCAEMPEFWNACEALKDCSLDV